MTPLSAEVRLALLERELWFDDQAALDQAVLEARQLASHQPSPEQRFRYAQLLCCLGEWREALQQLDLALESHKQFAPAYAERGLLYGLVERYDLGMLSLANAIYVDPTFYRGWSYRAVLHVRRGMWGDVVEDAGRSIELQPMYAPAYKLRGIAHQVHKNVSRAISDFEQYLELCPIAPDRRQIEQSMRDLRNPPEPPSLFDRLFKKRDS